MILAFSSLRLSSFAAASTLSAQKLPDHSAFTAVLREVVEQPLIDYQRLKDGRAGLDA